MLRKKAFTALLATTFLMLSSIITVNTANATNIKTKSGDFSSGCVVLWKTKAVLDKNLKDDDAEYPGLTTRLDGSPVIYSNAGYISEVTPSLGGKGIFEANHFFTYNPDKQNWRFPLATDHTIKAGTKVNVDLPDDMTNTVFDRVSTNERMSTWGEPYAKYTWSSYDASKLEAVQTDVAKNIWTLTFKKDIPAGHATVFQFTGDGNTNGRYVASAELEGAYNEGEGTCQYDKDKLPKLPPAPSESKCKVALLGRTVWSPYGSDITSREKFVSNWKTPADGWGEVNADGWGLGSDGWANDGKTATLRLYGAVDKDFQGGTYTATIAQNAVFKAGSVNTFVSPGAGALKGNGYTNVVKDATEPTISPDGKTITFKIGKLPAKSSFSFNVTVQFLRDVKDDTTGQILPMVIHEKMEMSSDKCEQTVETSKWSEEVPTCENPKVTQTRTVTTTPYVWNEDKQMWTNGEPIVKTERRIVSLKDTAHCSKEVTPNEPTSKKSVPKAKLAATGIDTSITVTGAGILVFAGALLLAMRRKQD